MWEACRPHLEAAIERSGGNVSLDYVRARLEDGSNTTHLWPGRRAAAVTEVCWFGERPVLNIWLAGGDMTELMEMLRAGEEFAKTLGCVAVRVEGRRGWVRQLREYGYEPIAYTVEKELTDGAE